MLSETVWPTPRYCCWFTPYDWSRSYLLPEQVATNIPRRGSLAGYGAHDWARGHLVELLWRLGGAPVSLHYRELLTRHPSEDPERVPAHLPLGGEVTACLRDPEGLPVTVVTRTESGSYATQGAYWEVTVNGETPADEDPRLNGRHAYPPSLPFLAFLVQQHLRTVERRRVAPVIPIRRKTA
ncbi:MAG TPA: hypothetical protein VFG15_03150 [Amycolatopsis sp.]|nr:hypothetical protein [Amycolatopsis sp.]